MKTNFYTFAEWLESHPELKSKIDLCDRCKGNGLVECPGCYGLQMEEVKCETCNDDGVVNCKCKARLKEEYEEQLRHDQHKLQLAVKAMGV